MNTNHKARHHFFLPLLKRQLKKPGLYLIALLCLLFLYIFDQVVFPSVSQQKYGVVTAEAECEDQLMAILKAQDGVYQVVNYPDRATLEKEVIAGHVDCGFVLDGRIDKVMDLNHMDGLADYISSTATLKGTVLQEKVFAAILQVVSARILEDLTRGKKVYEEESDELTAEVMDYYKYYLDGNETLQIDLEIVQVPEGMADKVARTFRVSDTLPDARRFALCGILIFACALIFARNKFSTESKSIFGALRGAERTRWRFLEIVNPVLIISLGVAAAYLILQLTGGENGKLSVKTGLMTTGILILFGIICAAWAGLYSCIFLREEIYLFTVPVVVILSVVTCPAIINLGGLVPVLGVLKWIFPATYL